MIVQYTVENPLKSKNPEFYLMEDIYIRVDENDLAALASLVNLSRFGVTVRKSSTAEVNMVEDWEIELDWSEPELCRRWPEEEGEIILQIKDW